MRRKTHEEFIQDVKDKVGEDYTVLSKYTISRGKVKVKHRTCGNIYEVVANSLLAGRRCPKCNGNKASHKTTSMFKKEIYALVKDEYRVLGDYINRSTNIRIEHKNCGRKYEVEPGNFLHGSRCVECYYDSVRLKQNEVVERVKKSLGEDYKVISDYRSSQEKIKVYHQICGEEFKVRYSDIIQKRSGCPHCNQSRGEQDVASYLKTKNIPYEFGKKFDDLRHIFQLSYDFYLPKHNILIEFQGEQHFRPKNFGNESREVAEENFQKQIIRDKIKRDYAKNNGYNLLEPDYTLTTYYQVVEYLDSKLTLLEVTRGALTQ